MSDLPRKAAARTARLARLPLGYAGRSAVGFGRRLGGAPAEAVMSDIQARTAEQVFRTLGELKGGAMKFGQALSIFEAALPEEMAQPYREVLTKLQDRGPSMDAATARDVLVAELGCAVQRDRALGANGDGEDGRRGEHAAEQGSAKHRCLPLDVVAGCGTGSGQEIKRRS